MEGENKISEVQVEPINLSLWLAEKKRQEVKNNLVYPVFVARAELAELVSEQIKRDLLKTQMSATKIDWWFSQVEEDWNNLFDSMC